MLINNVPIFADVTDILLALRFELANHGITLLQQIKDTPNNVMVSCPYHKDGQERRPSAGILKTDGTFHCFTCGETHSLPEVVSYCLGHYDDILGSIGFKWILQHFATVDVEVRKDVDLDYSRNPVCAIKSFVSEDELESYRVYHPYMWKRKMTPKVVEIFDVGYDAKTDCLTFPVRDINGNCLFVARRSVKTKFFNYPSGVEKPVYGLYELSQLSEYPTTIHICESMIDAITVWAYGCYAVALNGLGNELQIQQLNRMPCREFILSTDNDSAGANARRKLKTQIRGKIMKSLVLPSYRKDINELSLWEFQNCKEIFC